MNRISFKGYAQEGRFDPIKLPDATAKIAQEGERTLRGMRAVRDQDRRNRDSYESALKEKNANEARNRQDNFNFDTQMRQNYREAINKNYRTEIDNTRKEADNKAKVWESLSSLSKTAGEFAGKYKEKKDKEDELAGMNAVYASGITYEEWQQLKAGEAEINATDATINDLTVKLQARGVSVSQIDQMRNLSGKREYGARKAYAQKGGDEYGLYLAQSGNKEVNVNGQPMSLARAQANGDTKAIPQILNQLRTEYIAKYSGLDPAFANEYLFKGMRTVERTFNMNVANQMTQQTSAKLAQEDTARVKSDWEDTGAQGFYDNLTLYGGDRSQNRSKGLNSLKLMAQAGQFDENDLDSLKALPILKPGTKIPSTFGEVFGTQMVALQDAVYTKSNQDRTRANAEERQAKADFIKYIYENDPPAGYTEEQIAAIEARWTDEFNGPAPSQIQALNSQEERTDEDAREELTNWITNGLVLTNEKLATGGYSPKIKAEFGKYVKDQTASEANSFAIKSLQAKAREMLSEMATVNDSEQFLQMKAFISQDLKARVNAIMAPGTKSYNEALAEAIPQIRLEMEKGKPTATESGKGDYAMLPGIGGEGGFVRFTKTGPSNYATDDYLQNFKNEVVDNPSIVYREPVLSEPALNALDSAYKKGTLPRWAVKAAEFIKMDPFEFAETQLSLADRTDKNDRPPEAEVYGYTDDQFQRLLRSAPSSAKTARAMGLTSQGRGESPYTPMLNLIASKESRSTDPENDGYDAMNTGGADGGHTAFGSGTGMNAFGSKLTEMSVAEVMRLQANGSLHASGRYQIIGSTLRGLVNKGVLSPDELYSPEVQDRAAIELFHGRVGKFVDANDEEIVGLGQEWIGLQNVPREVMLQSLRNTAANLNNPNFNPEMMRDEIVYRVGNIGPTSTGAHLDVKQVGQDFFGRKGLDSYIGYKTASGFQPLSTGVTVPGGEFGASRSYGEHRGWDYAMPAGTPVVLKNGAKIVGIQKNTGHGDRLTIGLPDGRQFEILHGKA